MHPLEQTSFIHPKASTCFDDNQLLSRLIELTLLPIIIKISGQWIPSVTQYLSHTPRL